MEHRFLRACRRLRVDRTPVWFMRQAGRYLPEYRALRERHGLLDLCRTPELAADLTLQPLRRLEVDAALLFSEIVLPLEPMGLRLAADAAGTVGIEQPVRTTEDAARLRLFDPYEGLGEVLDAVRLVHDELDGHRPLIGFAGAPFTLAAYAIDGGPGGNFPLTKALMYGDPTAWHRLCEMLATVVADYLRAQVEAGADAVQLFDSWAGALDAQDYKAFVLPHSRRVFESLADLGVPTIHYATGTSTLLEGLAEAGGDVLGLDWRIGLDEARERLGPDRAVQGNLDPTALLGLFERMLEAAGDVLDRAGGRPGHIFNLGHGLLPSTSVERVQALVRYVHSHSAA